MHEWLVSLNDHQVINRKIKGLAHREYGYIKNIEQAKIIIDTYINLYHSTAILYTIKELTTGYLGYTVDYELGCQFIDYYIDKGLIKVMRLYLDCIAIELILN